MSNQQTDNDGIGFSYKVQLRLNSIKNRQKVSVLDCFSGHGWVWGAVQAATNTSITVTQLDKREDKTGAYLKGNSLKFLKTMDLSKFDLIDLDAYGTPIQELEVIFEKKYKGVVHVTFIQSVLGKLPTKMLTDLGYTAEMITKCPTLFNKNGFEKLCKWLKTKGLNDILYIQLKRKSYLYFNLGE